MTLAEAITVIEHAKGKADEAKIPYHKVLVTVIPAGGQRQELFPGPFKKLDQEQLIAIGHPLVEAYALELEAE